MCMTANIYIYYHYIKYIYLKSILYLCKKSKTISGKKILLQDPESFQCAIGPILGFAQLFGVLPVSGIRAPTPLKLKFAIFSFHTFYAVSITIMVLIMAILSIMHMIKTLNSSTFEMRGNRNKSFIRFVCTCRIYLIQKLTYVHYIHIKTRIEVHG